MASSSINAPSHRISRRRVYGAGSSRAVVAMRSPRSKNTALSEGCGAALGGYCAADRGRQQGRSIRHESSSPVGGCRTARGREPELQLHRGATVAVSYREPGAGASIHRAPWGARRRVMESSQPTEIRRQPATRTLRILWSDGHEADYPYDYLRGFCPCAGCQGHGAHQVEFQPTGHPVEPLTIRPVGNYAISFHWSDSHSTGIYRFDYLRSICPCGGCSSERGEGGSDGL